jgi:hypothetical protein
MAMAFTASVFASSKAFAMRPKSVISFFFGVDCPAKKQEMQLGTPLQTMNGIWFGSSDDDCHCSSLCSGDTSGRHKPTFGRDFLECSDL